MEQLELLLQKYPIIISILAVGGTLVVAATAYIKMTPNQDDDAWYEKIKQKPYIGAVILFFEKHSLVQRK